jgi:ATP phosphoribosyltransferase
MCKPFFIYEKMKLKIAIQKSGRLHEDSMDLLKACGIQLQAGAGKLKAEADNFPLEVFFLRDDDIPQYIEDGVADIGIVGENVLLEKNKKTKLIHKLGFGKCRLSLAIPKDKTYKSVNDFNGKRLATSYPIILSQFLKQHKLKAEIHEISGSVEIAPSIGLADAICDLVSSGSTLFTNGLKEVEVILRSEAVLVGHTKLDKTKQAIIQKLIFRIKALQEAKSNKYILLNAPNTKLEKICSILPGMKSPTILPLAQKGWSSVHSVVNETKFWDIIEQLKTEGAQGILVIPIEKMIV